ncbi:MAG: hypothetical protein MZV70_59495 [Desulfobacterales bacterium]|nr:hypothetical protein [Desulfobacterales bacterium]
MKKTILVMFIAIAIAFAGPLAMQVSAQTPKIAIVDLLKALNESETGKEAKTKLESLIKSKQVVIEEKGKNIEKIKSDAEKQASILSADARKGQGRGTRAAHQGLSADGDRFSGRGEEA